MIHIRGRGLLFHYSWDFVQNPPSRLSVKQTKQSKLKKLKSKIMSIYNTVLVFFWLSPTWIAKLSTISVPLFLPLLLAFFYIFLRLGPCIENFQLWVMPLFLLFLFFLPFSLLCLTSVFIPNIDTHHSVCTSDWLPVSLMKAWFYILKILLTGGYSM